MTSRFITGLFLFVPTVVSSQISKPDYQEIHRHTSDAGSPLYYPRLMERYTAGDSTLTLEDRRHLYYGYTFEPEYSPYGASNYVDSLKTLLKKDALAEDEYRTLRRFADSVLRQDPFDLRTMNFKLYADDNLRDREAFTRDLARMKVVVDAIMSSGDGKSKETAFYVISTSHEYDMLNILGLKFGGMQRLVGHFDYLTLGKNDAGLEGMYFDVSPCLEHLEKMFKN